MSEDEALSMIHRGLTKIVGWTPKLKKVGTRKSGKPICLGRVQALFGLRLRVARRVEQRRSAIKG